ncbi:general amidase-B [Aspergillus arachidicola]|uniref:General amidase-B n=1 Tax=Aspergillus arachidicola TaxID=656916 RepID=A0A2G7G962_9EURO|nr:general amidase-B [Aspergillus arachidicola]
MTIQTWQEKAHKKQTTSLSKIPPEWRLPPSIQTLLTNNPNLNCLDIPAKSNLLTPRELEITNTEDATALLAKISKKEYTSAEVTTAFSKRAAIAQQLTNCLTETFFDEALTRAKQLDEYLSATGKTIGPLHGLPISLKDSFNVAGIPSTLGFVSFLDRPVPTSNSALVDILLAAGAVVYVKTNIPQTLMTAESHNNIFGRVLNPHRINLAAGGSSGGEGALVALRGSLLGLLPEDPTRPYHPSMLRTISTAVEKLAAAGHKIIDLGGKCPSMKEFSDIAMQFFQMDPDRTPLGHLAASEEPWVPSLKYTYNPNGTDPEPTLRQLYDLNVQKADASTTIRKVFLDNGLDVILGPGHQTCAPVHDTFGLPIYTMLANLVDYPACIIPFGSADEVADAGFVRDVKYVPEYTAKDVEGAPCHIQLIGRRLKDELLMQNTQAIEGILKGK